MKNFLALYFLINVCGCVYVYAQSGHTTQESIKLTFHYNVNWELTTPEKSFVRREAYFDLQEMVFDGVYQDYNNNNKLIGEGYYAHGVKRGIQTEHFEDQSIKSTIEFSDRDFVIWQLVNDKREYEVAKGTGKFSIPYFYFFDYYLKQGTVNGEFANGKKTGTWIYRDLRKVKTDVEYYRNGKFLSRTHFAKNDSIELNTSKEMILSINSITTDALLFDKTSFTTLNQYFEAQITYPVSFQRNVTYPGGIKRLLRLLMEADVPENYLALVKIKVDEHGQVLKSNIVRSVDPSTDERVLKAMERYQSRFVPAIQDGKPYPTTIYLPVSGGERWEKTLNEMPASYFLNVNNFY
ncbi:MAG TPA: energy transducer TonB [Cyclobacteriaceae bacterium]|nr:energy transducer TonB [Cyclobacteriaceae bacterium]